MCNEGMQPAMTFPASALQHVGRTGAARCSCGMHLPGTCALWQGMIWLQNTANAHGKPMPTCHLHLRSATIMPLMASIALYMKP